MAQLVSPAAKNCVWSVWTGLPGCSLAMATRPWASNWPPNKPPRKFGHWARLAERWGPVGSRIKKGDKSNIRAYSLRGTFAKWADSRKGPDFANKCPVGTYTLSAWPRLSGPEGPVQHFNPKQMWLIGGVLARIEWPWPHLLGRLGKAAKGGIY